MYQTAPLAPLEHSVQRTENNISEEREEHIHNYYYNTNNKNTREIQINKLLLIINQFSSTANLFSYDKTIVLQRYKKSILLPIRNCLRRVKNTTTADSKE